MARPTTAQVWAGVQAAVQAAAGVTAIWRYQNADQPAGDYVAMSLGTEIPVDFDYTVERPIDAWAASTAYALGARVLHDSGRTYSCTTAGTSAASGGPTGTGSAIVDGTVRWAYVLPGGEVEVTLGGTREVALQLEVYSSALVEQVAQVTALERCTALVGRLRLPATRNALAAVGLVPFDPGPVAWVPTIVAAGFRGRATCDVRCRMPAQALREWVAYIASVELQATVGGAPGAITLPITAP